MIARYNDLLVLMRVDIPHADDPLVLQALQQAGREFCVRTEAWREKLTYNIVDSETAYTNAYNTAIANGMSTSAATVAGNVAKTAARDYIIRPNYDAEIVRLWKVWDNGDETQPIADPLRYRFFPSTNTLSWNTDLTTYTPKATTWTNGVVYAEGSYVIQDSLRYLCAIAHTAGTFATDLAAYRWQLMPNDLIVRAVLVPRVTCSELAAWFMEKWAEAIIAKAKADLMIMKNKNWSSPERVGFFEQKYMDKVAVALRERFAEDKSTGVRFTTPTWIP